MKFIHGLDRSFVAASTNKMEHLYFRVVYNFPPFHPHALAPVNILPVHVESFIQKADIDQCLSSDHHAGTGYPIHFNRLGSVYFLGEDIITGDPVIGEPFG